MTILQELKLSDQQGGIAGQKESIHVKLKTEILTSGVEGYSYYLQKPGQECGGEKLLPSDWIVLLVTVARPECVIMFLAAAKGESFLQVQRIFINLYT